MSKLGKFGGSRNENRTQDTGHPRHVPVDHLREDKQREAPGWLLSKGLPGPPGRTKQPFHGKRAQNVTPAEIYILDEAARVSGIPIAIVCAWYRIRFSWRRRQHRLLGGRKLANLGPAVGFSEVVGALWVDGVELHRLLTPADVVWKQDIWQKSAKTDIGRVLFEIEDDLNGNNGEATNTDDMPRNPAGRGKARVQSVGKTKKKARAVQPERAFAPVVPKRGRVRAKKINSNLIVPLKMSKCALKLALAYSDPFDPASRGVCGLSGTSVGLTYKVAATTRFTMVVGTGGVGVVYITPCMSNDGSVAFTTTSAYTGTTQIGSILSANNTLVTGVVSVQSQNLPYAGVSFLGDASANQNNANCSGRIISVGARITYTGTLLNESGTYTCYTDPAHNNLSLLPTNNATENTMTLASLQSYEGSNIEGISRKPCEMVMVPCSAQETSFSSEDIEGSGTGAVTMAAYPWCQFSGFQNNGFTYADFSAIKVGSPVGVICVSGAVAGNTFQVEIIQHVEFSGLYAQASGTPSESDEEAASKIMRAASLMNTMRQGAPEADNWTLMRSALSSLWNSTKEYLVPAAVAAVKALVL